ncbi:MAG: hypothetical protein ABI389_07900 [Rhodanobacter sp.]
MTHAATPVLARLRRYRGLWLLAFAALLLKLVTSSVCLGDLPAVQLTAADTTTTLTAAVSSTGAATAGDVCLLGEAGDCHCACAHALTLTSHLVVTMASVEAMLPSSRLSLGLVPDTTGSLLRPPIA